MNSGTDTNLLPSRSALNSGAATYMSDFEDSNAPTWLNNLDGQVNLYDAIRRKIDFKAPGGKEYKLNEKTATLIVRCVPQALIELCVGN